MQSLSEQKTGEARLRKLGYQKQSHNSGNHPLWKTLQLRFSRQVVQLDLMAGLRRSSMRPRENLRCLKHARFLNRPTSRWTGGPSAPSSVGVSALVDARAPPRLLSPRNTLVGFGLSRLAWVVAGMGRMRN